MSPEPVETPDPLAHARALFDRATTGLDPAMALRLRRSRQDALARRRSPSIGALLPAGAMAVVALAAAVAWWLPQHPPAEPTPTGVAASPAAATTAAPAASAAIAASAASPESEEIEHLLSGEEDAEMYAWLAEAPVAVTAGDAP